MTTKMSTFGGLSYRRGVEAVTAPRIVAKVVHVVVDGHELGLLVGWRRTAAGWEGCVGLASAPGHVETQWIPAGRIRPVQVSSR